MEFLAGLLYEMRETLGKAGSTAGLTGLFLSGLLALWYARARGRRETSFLFWYASILLLLIISPPYLFFVKNWAPGLLQSNMHLWLLPMMPVLLGVVYEGYKGSVTTRNAFALGIAFTALMLLAGTTSYNAESFKPVEDISYPDQELSEGLAVIDEFRSANSKESLLIVTSDKMMEAIRRYDPAICTAYGEEMWNGNIDPGQRTYYSDWQYELHDAMIRPRAKLRELTEIAGAHGVDLIVIDRDIPDAEINSDGKAVLIEETSAYRSGEFDPGDLTAGSAECIFGEGIITGRKHRTEKFICPDRSGDYVLYETGERYVLYAKF